MAIIQKSTKLREMTRVSATDKNWRQRRRTRSCKDGCLRQETTTRMGSGGSKDGRVVTMILVALRGGIRPMGVSNAVVIFGGSSGRHQQRRSRTENDVTPKARAVAGGRRLRPVSFTRKNWTFNYSPILPKDRWSVETYIQQMRKRDPPLCHSGPVSVEIAIFMNSMK